MNLTLWSGLFLLVLIFFAFGVDPWRRYHARRFFQRHQPLWQDWEKLRGDFNELLAKFLQSCQANEKDSPREEMLRTMFFAVNIAGEELYYAYTAFPWRWPIWFKRFRSDLHMTLAESLLGLCHSTTDEYRKKFP